MRTWNQPFLPSYRSFCLLLVWYFAIYFGVFPKLIIFLCFKTIQGKESIKSTVYTKNKILNKLILLIVWDMIYLHSFSKFGKCPSFFKYVTSMNPFIQFTYVWSSLLLRNTFCSCGVSPNPNKHFILLRLRLSSRSDCKPWRSDAPITLIWLPARLRTLSSLSADNPPTCVIWFPWRSSTSSFAREFSPSIRRIL
jgi:hypothetical protein